MLPVLKLGRILRIGVICWGIEVVGGDIYVTCNEVGILGVEGVIRILDLNGNMKRRLGTHQDGTAMFTAPYYLTVNVGSGRIYVTDSFQNKITCLRLDGTIIYRYKSADMKCPQGVCVDDEDNVIICSKRTKKVLFQSVSVGEEKNEILLSSKDGVKSPCSVAYRHTDHNMIIGHYNSDNLFVCKFARD